MKNHILYIYCLMFALGIAILSMIVIVDSRLDKIESFRDSNALDEGGFSSEKPATKFDTLIYY